MEMRNRLALVNVATLRTWWRPPWLEHPESPNGSIGWRMGYGEGYLMDFYRWLGTLDATERALYKDYPVWPRDTPSFVGSGWKYSDE